MAKGARRGRTGQAKVFRDPVHNIIEFDRSEKKLFLELIGTPEFQRLRRVRQLGLSFLTYPGAEHSRFAHSLGVYCVAKRMLDALAKLHGVRSSEFRELGGLRRAILVAALVHDIGHGPFSHLFEHALPGSRTKHEGWSQRIVSERFTGILRRHRVDAGTVCGLLNEKSREHLLAKDFISSQLDCDRIDYLLRDSLMAGAKYGVFDLDWLIHSLRIAEVATDRAVQQRLCFDSKKSMRLIESYILARESMYQQVYMHKTTRSYEALFMNILRLAAHVARGDPARAPAPCPPALARALAGEALSLQEYLELDDYRLWLVFQEWAAGATGGCENTMTKELRRKCDALVNRRKPYGVVELDDKKQEAVIRLLQRLEDKADWQSLHSCARLGFEEVPYKNVFYRKKAEDDEEKEYSPIYVLDEKGRPQEAEHFSEVVRAISEVHFRLFRLHYDRDDAKLCRILKAERLL